MTDHMEFMADNLNWNKGFRQKPPLGIDGIGSRMTGRIANRFESTRFFNTVFTTLRQNNITTTLR